MVLKQQLLHVLQIIKEVINLVEISLSEFTAYLNKANVFNFSSREYNTLYYFYLDHSQAEDYVVPMPLSVLEDFQSVQSFYAEYGIYLGERQEQDLFKRHYVLLLSEEDLQSEDAFKKKWRDAADDLRTKRQGKFKFSLVLASVNFKELDASILQKYVEVISISDKSFILGNKATQNVTTLASIFNRDQLVKYRESFPNATFIDVTDLLMQYNIINANLGNDRSLSMLEKLLSEFEILLEENKSNPNSVFLYLNSKKVLTELFCELPSTLADNCRNDLFNVYATLAAILTLQNLNYCVIEKATLKYYLAALQKCISADYLSCYDYLSYLKHPLDAGFFISNQSTALNSIAIRDYSKSSESACKIKYVYTPLENITSQKSDDLHKGSCDVRVLELVDIMQYYNLSASSLDEIKKQYSLLNDVIAKFERKVQKFCGNIDKKYVILNFRNVFLFKKEECLQIAYLIDVEISYPYAISTMEQKPKKGVITLNRNSLLKLLPVSVVQEGSSMVAQLKQVGVIPSNAILEHGYAKRCRGLLLTLLKPDSSLFREEHSLSFIDFGVWSMQSSVFRDGDTGNALKLLTIAGARAVQALDFFGGLHPQIRTGFTINRNELWEKTYNAN